MVDAARDLGSIIEMLVIQIAAGKHAERRAGHAFRYACAACGCLSRGLRAVARARAPNYLLSLAEMYSGLFEPVYRRATLPAVVLPAAVESWPV